MHVDLPMYSTCPDGRGDHLEEVGLEHHSDHAYKQHLACLRWAVEEHAFWGLDADMLEEL